MEKFSKLMSFLFFPLFLPLWGLGMLFCLDIFALYPIRYIHAAFLVTLMCCVLLPLISFFVLEKLGVISDVKMLNKEDRVIPLTFTAVFFAICSYELYCVSMPLFIVNIAVGTAISTLIVALISLRWKISGHMTGLGALVSSIISVGLFTYTNTSLVLCLFLLISGLVASARYYLNKHTLAQLAAGFANGFLVIQIFANSNISSLFRFF